MSEKMYQLAIIGAGPAGIAAAVECYLLGMKNIILIEKDDNHNATIRKFYKENKRVDKDWKGQKVELDGHIYLIDGTKESTLDFFDEVIAKHSVELKTHTEVQKIVKHKEHFEVMFTGGSVIAEHTVVTIGRMGKPNKPDYKIPGSIKKRVTYSIEERSSDEKILVVGGGDSAIEYAVDLAQNNDVSICYRRKNFRRANPTNQKDIADALERGSMRSILGVNILALEDDEGKVRVILDEGEAERYDRVIYAIGGTTPSAFLTASNIGIKDGRPIHDENYMSDVEGLYVAGDITQENGGSIALGLNHGYAIANHILKERTV